MKRFVFDGFVIILLLAIGMSMAGKAKDESNIEGKQKEFEEGIKNNEVTNKQVKSTKVTNDDDNFSSRLAQGTSEFIVDVTKNSTDAIVQFFNELSK